jgi:carbon-monoxide dehydrogenase medium subunit
VRNAATVGGVVAEADYASDPPAALVALDAEVEVYGPDGTRRIPVAEFFQGFYQTALAPNEIVVAVRVPVPPEGTHGVYEKFTTRSTEDRPCIGVVALARFHAGGWSDLRVVVGAATETPRRYPDHEALASGAPTAGVMAAIAAGYARDIDALDDMRGSAWYRKTVIEVWVRRSLGRIAAEATG